MKLKIEVNMNNSAFEDDCHQVKTILDDVAVKVESGWAFGPIKDTNGNNVGRFTCTEEEE